MTKLLNLLLKGHQFVTGKCCVCGQDFIYTEEGDMLLVNLSRYKHKPKITDIACKNCKKPKKRKNKLTNLCT